MSIKRIESVYATYKDDPEITAPQMAVLVSLAYCANEGKNEACYPGLGYLKELTHFGATAIKEARKALRKRGIIDWTNTSSGKGDFDSNDYTFLFPLKKLVSKRIKYEPVSRETTGGESHCDLGSVVKQPTVSREAATNTGTIPEIISVRDAGRGVGKPKPMFEVSGVLKKADTFKASPCNNGANGGIVHDILALCKENPNDRNQVLPLNKFLLKIDFNDVMDEYHRFKSEIEQGEHKNLRKPIAEFMKRLSRYIPQEKQAAAKENLTDLAKAVK